MTYSPRPAASAKAGLAAALAAVAVLAISPSALAQDETVPEPTSYTTAEDGSVTHAATGIVCPGVLGDLIRLEVLSFDRNDEHLGLTCNYASQIGSNAAISLVREDVPELTGPGTEAERWNRALYTVLANYEGALPAQIDGLNGDESINLRGALFTTSGARGVPLQIGLWRVTRGGWVVSGEIAYLPTAGGWTGAAQLRRALVNANTELE